MPIETKGSAEQDKVNFSEVADTASIQINQWSKRRFVPYQSTEGEPYMNENQRAHFEQLLLQWDQDLQEERDHMRDQLRSQSGNLPDASDAASQEEALRGVRRRGGRDQRVHAKVKEALQRLKYAHYGYCESCDNEIGIKRLEARPIATLCIDCKELEEIQEEKQ